MSMQEAILAFNEQFKYEPVMENSSSFKPLVKYVVLGMGGSHLAASLLELIDPDIDVIIHRAYGLPTLSTEEKAERLFIASSYSGNTEEIIDGLEQVLKEGLPAVVIATGGKLIDLAQENNLPYVQLPATGIQPRSALGYSLLGLLKIIGHPALEEASKLAGVINSASLKEAGQSLANNMKDQIPVIYSSLKNWPIAYNWKIKFNETGKIPAFYNVVPELNHNEMTGFDVKDSSKHLSEHFYFIFIKDDEDDARVLKRFEILKKLYLDRGLPITVIDLNGATRLEKIFNSLLLADWTAVHTADLYGLESEQVPMVEEFKKLIA